MNDWTIPIESLARIAAIDGWLLDQDVACLYSMARECRENARVLEVGTYKGKSTTALALGLRGPDWRIYCIDTWDGNDTDCAGDRFRGTYAAWDKNCAEFRGHLIPMPGKSHDMLAVLNKSVRPASLDLCFIDGSHTEAVVARDLELALPLVRHGGRLAFHDYHNPKHPGPTAVWDNVASKILVDHQVCGLIVSGARP